MNWQTKTQHSTPSRALKTRPSPDEAAEAARHCGAFTISKDERDATLLFRLLPNGMIGPIVSIRPLEFESFFEYGVDPFDSWLFETISEPCESPLAQAKSHAKTFR